MNVSEMDIIRRLCRFFHEPGTCEGHGFWENLKMRMFRSGMLESGLNKLARKPIGFYPHKQHCFDGT